MDSTTEDPLVSETIGGCACVSKPMTHSILSVQQMRCTYPDLGLNVGTGVPNGFGQPGPPNIFNGELKYILV